MGGKVYIGTSGWQYRNWLGLFYPENLAQKDWLRYYAKYFDTVEVNSSFYRQTKTSTFQKWQSETPSGFVFAVKGNRFVTHIKRLKDCEEALERFFESANVLTTDYRLPTTAKNSRLSTVDGKHVVLWQLPPNLKQDIPRLEAFLKLLPKDLRYAFEFRNDSWVGEDMWETLKKYNAAAVFQDWHEWPQIREVTADFMYVRLHGHKVLYTSGYSDEELREWASKIKKWLKNGKDAYAYFNNDAAGYAAPNALKLKGLVTGD